MWVLPAQRALWEYIEAWYNRTRRHQTLGYRTPMQYEREVLKADVVLKLLKGQTPKKVIVVHGRIVNIVI